MSCFVVSPFVAASRYCVVCEAQRHTVLSVCSIGFEFLIASFCFLPVARVFSWRGFVFDTKLQMKFVFVFVCSCYSSSFSRHQKN